VRVAGILRCGWRLWGLKGGFTGLALFV